MNELLSLHQKIAREILKEYQRTHRQLPWRSTKDPYAIWVSEIMLQQTQSNTVIPYYHKWLKAFPTVDTLAHAPIDTVLSIWSGLGYYRRAHNLHHGAREIMTQYNGTVPSAVPLASYSKFLVLVVILPEQLLLLLIINQCLLLMAM